MNTKVVGDLRRFIYCPQCGEQVVHADIGDGKIATYCEDCGWPDEDSVWNEENYCWKEK